MTKDAFVTSSGGHHRKPGSRVARCGFDNRAPRLEEARAFGRVDDIQRDAVFHASTGIEVFDFGIKLTAHREVGGL
jgi:hypothetical protein